MTYRDFRQIDWGPRLEDDCRQIVRLAVREDLDRGQDWTTVSLIPSDCRGAAEVVVRQSGVIAGLSAAASVLCEMDAQVRWSPLVNDGNYVEAGQSVARIEGVVRDILTSERIFLNFLGRLSGIASVTHTFVKQIEEFKAEIYDTRKTTPGWRRLEKYAVRCGGGRNHRTGLFDAILIKDNHLAVAPSGKEGKPTVADACHSVRNFLSAHPDLQAKKMVVEIEVDDLDQLREVLPANPDIVLLDNMQPANLREAVMLRDQLAPQIILEASGGVHLKTIEAIAETGIDRISVGGLTHSAIWLDVGLDWGT